MTNTPDQLRGVVRDTYGAIARKASEGARGCGCAPTCCEPESKLPDGGFDSERLGYSAEDLDALPDGADLGLGCGNPQALASLKPGEDVLDLGSGGGVDCFLAGQAVGDSGSVIGVDMTADMISLARTNTAKVGATNVEFRLGEIEHLPVADASVDVVLSNCVVNLSPDKPAVWSEAFRVLRPGGRVAISDILALRPLPEAVRESIESYAACLGGAATIADVEQMLADAGFVDIRVDAKLKASADFIAEVAPGCGFEGLVASATIEATKPV